MTEPHTDSPVPRRPNIRLTLEEVWDFVERAHTGILTTLRRDGMPVATPTWFAAIERRIYLWTPSSTKKVARVRRDPRASFLVESGEKWAELKAVHFTGHADAIDDDGDLLAHVRAVTDEKYAAFRTAPSAMPTSARAKYGGSGTVIRFTPDDRVLSWDNSRLALKADEEP